MAMASSHSVRGPTRPRPELGLRLQGDFPETLLWFLVCASLEFFLETEIKFL